MSFFKRKDANQIPLPPSRVSPAPSPQPNVLRRDSGPAQGGPPSYRSNISSNQGGYGSQAPMYQPSSNETSNYYGDQKAPAYDDRNQPPPRGGYGSDPRGGYGNDNRGQSGYGSDARGGYGNDDAGGGGYSGRPPAVGDPYARGGRNVDADRNELFAGYNADRAAGRNRFDDRPGRAGGGSGRWQDRTPQNQEEEEEDVEGIKQDIRQVKNDSANSTRNALRLAREAEETARNTLVKLGDQSEKIANSERLLDQSKGHTARAEDRTSEIKKLNRSIFRPAITFNKEGKRMKEEQRLTDRHNAERDERERAGRDVRDSANRIGRANTYDEDEDQYGADDSTVGRYGRKLTEKQQQERKAGRSRFQFESTGSDDEIEDQIDDNLDEIHDITKRLKSLATAQGEELQNQNTRLTRMGDNTTRLDDRLQRATNNLKRI